jgi:hypothetical protein
MSSVVTQPASPAVEKFRPKPRQSRVLRLAGVGNLTVHDHDFGVFHIQSPDERMLRHMPDEHPC